jgi:hypothetical protein
VNRVCVAPPQGAASDNPLSQRAIGRLAKFDEVKQDIIRPIFLCPIFQHAYSIAKSI